MDLIYANSKQSTKLVLDGQIAYVQFKALEDINMVKHGFSTKFGGVSDGIYSSMNLGIFTEDEATNIEENYNLICNSLGVEQACLVYGRQIHEDDIYKIEAPVWSTNSLKERAKEGYDGYITNQQGVTLVTFHADCVPLYFVDPVQKAIGLAHSGWRGTVKKIGKKIIESMTEAYSSNPNDIIGVIGPSISSQYYEVGEEVTDQFKRVFSKEEITDIIDRNSNGRYQLDLWRANEVILKEAGLCKENIHITDLCTYENHKTFFSHRYTGGKRGLLAAFLSLK